MVIDNLDVEGVATFETKAQSPLFVDAQAPLPGTVSLDKPGMAASPAPPPAKVPSEARSLAQRRKTDVLSVHRQIGRTHARNDIEGIDVEKDLAA